MSKKIRALALVIAAALLPSCVFTIDVEIDSPTLGAFVDADSVQVTGHMSLPGVTVSVNGAEVPVAADGRFQVDVPFAPDQIFQPLVAEMRYNGTLLLDRDVVTVVKGVGVTEDELAPHSLGVRLTEAGFAAA